MRRSRRGCVLKSDGVFERFSTAKLARCLRFSLEAADETAAFASRPLAEAICAHFRQAPRSVPSSADVFSAACQVLEQTGMPDAAARLRAHRAERDRARGLIRVFETGPGGGVSLTPWSKAPIVAALVGGHALSRPASRAIAAEVESRVLALGFRTVHAKLVEGLVETELASWGLVGDLDRGCASWAGALGEFESNVEEEETN